MKKIHHLLVDCQNTFAHPNGHLYVNGAEKAMDNLANFIKKHSKKIDDITATMDSHQLFHIAHPIFWKDKKGNHPTPFTKITLEDFNNGLYRTSLPSCQLIAKNYLEQLKKNARYDLTIWPSHAEIGTWDHNIYDSVMESLNHWCKENFGVINFCVKGSNPFTEHYSAIFADVQDPNDPTTQVNVNLLKTLHENDIVLISGIATNFCVANTVRDACNYFNDDSLAKKMVLLEDTVAAVSHPLQTINDQMEKLTNDFLSEMTSRGMKVSNTKDFF